MKRDELINVANTHTEAVREKMRVKIWHVIMSSSGMQVLRLSLLAAIGGSSG